MSVNTLKEKVEEYLELLKEIKQKTGDERTALAILQEVNKDVRMDRISFERTNKDPWAGAKPASARQMNFLKKLGVEVPDVLTKEAASALIDEELGKQSKEESSRDLEARVQENVPLPWFTVKW